MSETKTKAEKPPAHEVLLDRIEEAQHALQGLAKLSCRRKGARASRAGRAVGATIREHRSIAIALLDTLNRMHLPESERPKILQRLHALDAEVIGGPQRPYVQILKELDGSTSRPQAK